MAVAPKAQVKLQLTTKNADDALPGNTGPILVDTSFRRYALSTLVNHLLENGKPTPFEFLVNGQFLRTSIDEYLTANGISAETLLQVEYVRAIVPPTHVASYQHDDWVSDVHVLSSMSPAGLSASTSLSGREKILSASYDGLLRVWNMSSEVIATSASAEHGGHTWSVTSARWVSPIQIVSAGWDRTVKVWKYSEGDSGISGKLTPTLDLYGHKAAIEQIDVHGPSAKILSASKDHSVGIWSTHKSKSPEAPTELLPNVRSAKRRKLAVSVSTPQRGPLALLDGHSAPVTGVKFKPDDHTVGYSVSEDHTLRTWDLTTTQLVDTRYTSHSLLSLEALSQVNLIAVGTSARHIALIDPRVSAADIAAMTLRGHTNFVVTLAKDPKSDYGLLSGSHDGMCKIWDVRSSKRDVEGVSGESIYTISRDGVEGKRVAGEGVKVFGVCWDASIGIVSGGEDKKVQINRGSDLLEVRK